MTDLTGKCIRMAMTKKDINNEDMAKACGVSVTSICNWRAGDCNDIRRLRRAATACDMTFEEMMELAK